MKLFLVLADSPIKPCGGLGERWKNLLRFMADFEIYGVCLGQGGNIYNVHLEGIDEQSDYFFISHVLTKTAEKLLAKTSFKPDIVLSTDHFTVPTGWILSQQFNATWIIEFNLALYSYQKQYDPKKLHPSLAVYSDHINYLEKFASENADYVVTCSEYYKDELPYKTKNWTPPKVICNGINLSEFDVEVKKYEFPGECKHNLVFIGRLNTQKGVRLLLDMKLPEDTALHFVGPMTGSDLFNEIIQLKPDTRKFYLGYKEGIEKVQILKSADAVLFPSLHEPFGIVGLEIMASKVPMITTLVGGIRSYASEDICIKCEPTVESLEEAVHKLLSMSENEKKQMVEKAYEKVKQFDWNNVAKEYVNFLQSVYDKNRH